MNLLKREKTIKEDMENSTKRGEMCWNLKIKPHQWHKLNRTQMKLAKAIIGRKALSIQLGKKRTKITERSMPPNKSITEQGQIYNFVCRQLVKTDQGGQSFRCRSKWRGASNLVRKPAPASMGFSKPSGKNNSYPSHQTRKTNQASRSKKLTKALGRKILSIPLSENAQPHKEDESTKQGHCKEDPW